MLSSGSQWKCWYMGGVWAQVLQLKCCFPSKCLHIVTLFHDKTASQSGCWGYFLTWVTVFYWILNYKPVCKILFPFRVVFFELHYVIDSTSWCYWVMAVQPYHTLTGSSEVSVHLVWLFARHLWIHVGHYIKWQSLIKVHDYMLN